MLLKRTSIPLQQFMAIWKPCRNIKSKGMICFCLTSTCLMAVEWSFVKKIRETSEIPILFLTANDTEQDMLAGFGVGCDDYIPKPFSIEVLRKKVQAVLKRTGGGKSRIRYRDLEVDTDKCLVLLNGEEVRLTSTEYKLLCYLIENKGRIVTKAMLLEQLWDIDGNFVDENTVRVNIKRLRQKLNDDKQEYIITVFGMGYTFGE